LKNVGVDSIDDVEGAVVLLDREAEDTDGGRPQRLLTVVQLITVSGDDDVPFFVAVDSFRELGCEAHHCSLQLLTFHELSSELGAHGIEFCHDCIEGGFHNGRIGWGNRTTYQCFFPHFVCHFT